ncbi:hypothetical protein A3731_05545 [Roseovarius sp. HI0049]|nr:hypothetical protein A3731_05545 [Roseovarius sp. HI0049]
MAEKAPYWVVPVMRTGYGARGAVYLVVGTLALMAAIFGGNAEGTTGALQQLKSQAWGVIALWGIGLGLLCFMVWRIIDAVMDLEAYGTGLKGVVARTGQFVTGVIHGALGVWAIALALGIGTGGQGSKSWTAKLLATEYGPWIMGLAGAAVVGTGIYYFYKAYSEKYKSHLKRTALMERLDPAAKVGLVAHGVAVALIGGFLIYAAVTASPEQAGGLGKAFDTVRQVAFGRILLILLTAGLIAFAVFCFIEAVYRIVPARAGPDVKTLAKKAERKADPRV